VNIKLLKIKCRKIILTKKINWKKLKISSRSRTKQLFINNKQKYIEKLYNECKHAINLAINNHKYETSVSLYENDLLYYKNVKKMLKLQGYSVSYINSLYGRY
jgi:phosphoribosyl-ATP pyrophosphohydrolase